MFSPRVCFISTALPYVQDSFKELVPMWMLPPETPHKFFCCKSWMWRRGGRFAVRWRSCGLLSFRVPVHTDTLYAHHVGGCRGATMPITSLLHFPPVLSTPPKPPTHLSTLPPPRFSTLTSGQKCGSHACKIVSLNIVLGTEPSITEKTKSCLSPVLWAIN